MQTKLGAPLTEPLSLDRQATVALTGAGRSYRSRAGEVEALRGVDLELGPGELVGVVGPSGCGKSTLLELVCGLQQPDAGEIVVAGEHAAGARLEHCAYMPQRDLLLPWRSALDNAALALQCAGIPRARARLRARPLFERFGLAQFERARPAELSGGMRQRVAFLRTLLPRRPVLLLDEPFASLDSITRAEMQEWLAAALRDEPRTTLLVTHDVEEALYLADRVVVMSARPGRIVAELTVPFERPRPRPRNETVTDPEFARLRRAALEALAQ